MLRKSIFENRFSGIENLVISVGKNEILMTHFKGILGRETSRGVVGGGCASC